MTSLTLAQHPCQPSLVCVTLFMVQVILCVVRQPRLPHLGCLVGGFKPTQSRLDVKVGDVVGYKVGWSFEHVRVVVWRAV